MYKNIHKILNTLLVEEITRVELWKKRFSSGIGHYLQDQVILPFQHLIKMVEKDINFLL